MKLRSFVLGLVALAALAAAAFVVLSGDDGEDSGPSARTVLPDAPEVTAAPAKGTYYVDSEAGDDGASGQAEDAAWQSLGRVSSASFEPGDRVLFRRGGSWKGTLTIRSSGSGDKAIIVGAYGEGDLPRFSEGEAPAARVDGDQYEGSSKGACIVVEGSNVDLRDLEVTGCRPARAGIEVKGDDVVLQRLLVADTEAAIVVGRGADHARILANTFEDNNLMTVNTCGGTGDYGAYTVALEGSQGAEVAFNVGRGAAAKSCDYGVDGSMVEVYKSSGNYVHDNVSDGNVTFAEIGGEGSTHNRFAFNRVTGSEQQSTGFVVHGGGNFGGTSDTDVVHNTVRLVGGKSIAIGCFGACSNDILRARNNIFAAPTAGQAAGSFDDDYNLYSGRVGFPLGNNSRVANPGFAGSSGVSLRPNSPAKGAATKVGDAPEGEDSGPDLGAVQPKA